MTVGDHVTVKGYVTQDKYLLGRDLAQIERILGYRAGRLATGATFVKLDVLPEPSGFELAGYSMTAEHHYLSPTGLDLDKLKAIAITRWSLAGPDRLVKVWPAIAHDPTMQPDEQYPPGAGAPQWRLVQPLAGRVVAEIATAHGIYRPAF